MNYLTAVHTDVGIRKKTNQDSALVMEATTDKGNVLLTVVCDGMGGANAGDIASKTAVEIISQYVVSSYVPTMDADDILKLVENAITSANIEIYDMSKKDERLSGMGTTAVVAIVKQNQAYICNIGDSRAYIIGDSLKQITRDHSVVQNLVESGKLSPEEARVHPKKNVITRALGVEDNVLTDVYSIDFSDKDIILLCTDGLSNYVESKKIFETVKNSALDKITELLICEANNGGGRDNITAAVISD